MTLIFIIITVLFLILLKWLWHSLGNIEKTTKIKNIIVSLIIVYIVTWIIYSISKIGITYESKDAMKLIQTVFVMLFTILNGYIILPFTFRKLEQINNEEISKEKLVKIVIILFIVIVLLFIIETMYLKSIQQGILLRGKGKTGRPFFPY